MKNIGFRFINGFCYSIAITLFIVVLVMQVAGKPVMLPEFVARYESEAHALGVQLLLVGIMSAVTSAGTVVFEMRRLGLLIQSIIFLFIMMAAWIPTTCFLWGFHKYPTTAVSCVLSMVGTYGICWFIQYKLCYRDVEEINRRLKEKEAEV